MARRQAGRLNFYEDIKRQKRNFRTAAVFSPVEWYKNFVLLPSACETVPPLLCREGQKQGNALPYSGFHGFHDTAIHSGRN